MMTDILITNARIWTNSSSGLIEDGFVAVQGDQIAAVGPMSELPEAECTSAKELIDAQGRLVLPGFVCAHTHLYSALARGMTLSGVNPRSFRDILEQIWWRLDKALDHDSIYYSALIGGIEFIKHGVTTIIDHHASPNSIRGSLKTIKRALIDELGLRAALCYEISDRDGPERVEQAIAENIEFLDYARSAQDDRLSALIGLHASFTISDATFTKLKRELGDREVGFHIHLAEGPEDQEDSLKRYNKRVGERLRDLEILNSKTILAHGIHLDGAEKDILAQHDAIVVHNPQSNMNNAVGVADIAGILNRNILVGLGNDGFGYEMLSDLRVMFLVHKLVNADPQAMGPDQVQRVFLRNNYTIVKRFFGIDIGKIEPGYKADLIIVNYLPPTPLTAKNFMGHLIFGIAGNLDVLTTIVDGRVLLRDRRVAGLDEEQVYREAREVARHLWKRID